MDDWWWWLWDFLTKSLAGGGTPGQTESTHSHKNSTIIFMLSESRSYELSQFPPAYPHFQSQRPPAQKGADVYLYGSSIDHCFWSQKEFQEHTLWLMQRILICMPQASCILTTFHFLLNVLLYSLKSLLYIHLVSFHHVIKAKLPLIMWSISLPSFFFLIVYIHLSYTISPTASVAHPIIT